MDQRSDHIRQNIESTRASLDEKLDSLENKARETFDLKHQVSERPWMALGAAVAAGFVLGSMGGGEDEQRWHGQPITTTDYNQHASTSNQHTYNASPSSKSSVDSFMSQFDGEIEMLKGAAISAITNLLHDSIRAYVPAMGQYLEQNNRAFSSTSPSATSYSSGADMRSRTPSTATNTSYNTGVGRTSFDSPPATSGQSNQLSNPEVGGSAPYYPPGSTGSEGRDYVKTYHPPSESDRERAVGEESGYWREANT